MNSAEAVLAHAPQRRSCPHCSHRRIHRWGRFSGRQRYRCLECRRTFSTYTGTALYYVKRTDAWPRFLNALQASLSVRDAAGTAGIHRDTAFRFRHRFLAALERGERVILRDEAAVGTTWFRYSRKGAKSAGTAARTAAGTAARTAARTATGIARRPVEGEAAARVAAERQVWVILARDTHGFAVSVVLGSRQPYAEGLASGLRARIAPSTRLHSHRGPYGSEAACARRLGLPFKPYSPGRSQEHPEPIRAEAVRIKRWMRRFRGVATRYLSHYLTWFRAMDTGWSPAGWELELVAMAPPGSP